MDIDKFQNEALKSVALPKKDVAALSHRTLGLSGEAGIISNRVKKVIRDKGGRANEADITELKKRLGDTLYYVAVLAEYFDLKLSEVAKQNIHQSRQFKENREK